jgi:hypothetical protein
MAKKPNSFNKFMNLLVLGVIIYALATTYLFPSKTPPLPSPNGNPLYQTKPDHQSLGLDGWAQAFGVMGKAVQPVLNVISEKEGAGLEEAVCGQNVTYRFSDKVIGEAEPFIKNKTASIKLGVDPIIEGHLRALYAMKVGGEKTVQFSSMWGYDEKSPEIIARGKDIESLISLISLTPPMPKISMPYRIFYNHPHSLVNETLRCGQAVKAKFRLWTIDSKPLYPQAQGEPEWVNFTIGKSEVPLGLEIVAQNLSDREKATAILPGELMILFNPSRAEPTESYPLGNVVYPRNQPIIVDIEAIEAIEAGAAPNIGNNNPGMGKTAPGSNHNQPATAP